jgi:EmrB/QacA subfamily drug resistance transporter
MAKSKSSCEVKKESGLRKWLPVFVLSLALAIILIDATLLNVSLGTLVKDLNTDIKSLQWVITIYSLTIASLTITGGRLGDLFGRKKMFVFGAVLFAIGSFIASISQNVTTMIIGESLIEGVGAAMMMPATASLLVSKYHGRDRGIAFGIWGGVAGASTAVGPLLGGWLATDYSWRWGFRINVFVAALLILGSLIITECRDEEEKPSLDVVGVLLSSLGLLSFVYGIIESSTYGWWKAKETYEIFGKTFELGGYSITPIAMAVGVALIALFVLWQGKIEKLGKTPLVSLSIFKNKQFMSGMLTTGIMSLGQSGLIFSIPVFLQSVKGANALDTGKALLPLSIAALIAAPIGGAIAHKVSTKKIIIFGLGLNLIGYIVLFSSFNVNSVARDFMPALVLMGIGMGMNMASLSNLTLSAVSPEQSGEASGVNNTLRQVGGTLGTAIVGAVLLTSVSTYMSDGIKNSSVIPEVAKAKIAAEAEKQSANVEFGGVDRVSGGIKGPIADEMIKITKQSITDANKDTLKYSIGFAVVALLAAMGLPKSKDIETEVSLARKEA